MSPHPWQIWTGRRWRGCSVNRHHLCLLPPHIVRPSPATETPLTEIKGARSRLRFTWLNYNFNLTKFIRNYKIKQTKNELRMCSFTGFSITIILKPNRIPWTELLRNSKDRHWLLYTTLPPNQSLYIKTPLIKSIYYMWQGTPLHALPASPISACGFVHPSHTIDSEL